MNFAFFMSLAVGIELHIGEQNSFGKGFFCFRKRRKEFQSFIQIHVWLTVVSQLHSHNMRTQPHRCKCNYNAISLVCALFDFTLTQNRMKRKEEIEFSSHWFHVVVTEPSQSKPIWWNQCLFPLIIHKRWNKPATTKKPE